MTSARRVRQIRALVSTLTVGVAVIAMAAPLLWLIDTALMGSRALYSTRLHVVPVPVSLASWIQLNKLISFGQDFLNSLIVSLSQTLGVLLIALTAAYALTRVEWRGRHTVFVIYVAAIAIPLWSVLIPDFLIVKSLGWLNTYQGLIVPGLINPLAIFLLRQFLMTVPRELDEAARMDGASRLRILGQILLPNMYPGLLAAGILAFLLAWNNLIWPLLVVQHAAMDTVPLGLSRLAVTGTGWGLNVYWGPLMMGTLLAALPTILVFAIAQRWFVGGLSTAGVRR